LRLNLLLLTCMVVVRPLFFLEVFFRVGVEPIHLFTILSGALFDLLLVGRILCFGLLPFLLLYHWKPRLAQGIFIGLMVLYFVLNALLAEYYCNLSMPLDHVILVYTPEELKTTVFSSASISFLQVLWFLLLVGVPVLLMICLRRRFRYFKDQGPRSMIFDLVLVVAALLLTVFVNYPRLLRVEALYPTHDDFCLAVNQPSYSFVKITDYLHDQRNTDHSATVADGSSYPFYREANDPDVMAPFFEMTTDSLPPNLVVVVVESLGRRLTGVDEPAISFTPFLDSLARHSLFWPNCLSTSERTFGVLPSMFASAPHGRYGFSTPLAPTPRHHSLLKDLKRNGYHTSFFYGGDMAFDRYDFFLKDNGVDYLFEPEVVVNDSATYRLMVENHRWGLDDAQLFYAAAQHLEADTSNQRPWLDLYLTLSTHEPFFFEGIGVYEDRVRHQVEQAKNLSDKERDNVLKNPNIFACFLYTDQCIRDLFSYYQQRSDFANTIFVITGDHRMGPLPFGNAIHKYNVPLIVYSPLLKRPKTMHAVVSHLDVTPSFNAYLQAQYHYNIDSCCHWLGQAFDTTQAFRSQRQLLFMLNNRDVVDYLHGDMMLSRSKVARLDSCFRETILKDEALMDSLKTELNQLDQLSRFVVSNDMLLPPEEDQRLLYECRLDFEKNTLAVFDRYLDRDSGFLRIDSLKTYFPICSNIKIKPIYQYLTIEVSFDIKNLDPSLTLPEFVADQGGRLEARSLASEEVALKNTGQWEHVHLRSVVNVFDQQANEELALYLWNKHKTNLLLDNLRINVCASTRRP